MGEKSIPVRLKSNSNESQTYILNVVLGHNARSV